MQTFKQYTESTSDLNDAIKDLVDRIKNDGFANDLVKNVADDWAIKAPLLDRMFTQKYGKAPKDFVIKDIEAKVVEVAKRKAEEFRKQFSGGMDTYVGKTFSEPDGRKYAFVAWTGKTIYAISVPGMKKYTISFNHIKHAISYMDKHGLSTH